MNKNGLSEVTTYSSKSSAFDDEGERLQKRAHRISKGLTVLRIIARVIDLLTSIVTVGMMSDNLAKYYKTINDKNGTQNLWSTATMLYPNFLTLTSATITLLFAIIILLAYCWGTQVADRWDNRRATFSKIVTFIHVASTVASTVVMWDTRNNPNSLSGQTCGAPPEKAPLFPQINFDQFCLMQDLSAGLMGVQAVTGILTGITFCFGYMETRTKKQMERVNAENLARAPISSGTDTEAQVVTDTKYTKV